MGAEIGVLWILKTVLDAQRQTRIAYQIKQREEYHLSIILQKSNDIYCDIQKSNEEKCLNNLKDIRESIIENSTFASEVRLIKAMKEFFQ